MNSSHYPNIELCRKLTEAGFPEETSCHFRRNNSYIYEHTFWPWNDESYVCPSVMELLDEMPKRIQIKNWWLYYYVSIDDVEYPWLDYDEENLPNALAEMYLFLKENWYIWK